MDDVRIYPRALSADEVAQLYNGTLTSQSPPSYDDWVAGFVGLSSTQRAPLADPDGDGISNLLEYALGGSLDQPDAGLLPQTGTMTSGSVTRLTLTFTPAETTGLRYLVQASTDLSNWTDETDITPRLTPGQPYLHLDSADLTTTPRRFLRLLVERQ